MGGPNVKEGYPDKLTVSEIKKEIDGVRRYANGGEYRADLIMAANSMIQSGQTELNNRSTKKAFWITFTLTLLTIIVAGISIFFSFKTDKFDSQWRQQEIDLLQNINNELVKSRLTRPVK